MLNRELEIKGCTSYITSEVSSSRIHGFVLFIPLASAVEEIESVPSVCVPGLFVSILIVEPFNVQNSIQWGHSMTSWCHETSQYDVMMSWDITVWRHDVTWCHLGQRTRKWFERCMNAEAFSCIRSFQFGKSLVWRLEAQNGPDLKVSYSSDFFTGHWWGGLDLQYATQWSH